MLTKETQAVRNQIAEAQKIASGSGSEQDIAEAKIELEVSILKAGADYARYLLTECRFWRASRVS